ncbi:MAG: malate/lactate/ureidoglycolate dehydrogenase [Planctomycetaceae bacterium]
MKLSPDAGTTLVAAIFTKVGSSADEADCIAEHLIGANLAGHDSHGVIRVPIYVRWINEEKVFPNRTLNVLIDTGAILAADGQMGFGQWIGNQAVELGITRCREHGVAIVTLKNVGHLGRIGHWAEMAAKSGLVSLHFVNTSGLGMLVVPAGGIDRRLSVNPVSIGVPMEGREPIILDIAAAATAEGKLKVARNKGVPVPEGWIVDADGNPTTDANKFYGPPYGAILPMGGHKGSGLAIMGELFAGAMTGSGCSAEGKTRLEQGMFSLYVDPLKLQTAETLFPEIRRYVDFVRTARPKDPEAPVLIPGEIEDRNRAARRRDGIDLDDVTWGQLTETATTCGVPADVIDAAVVSR